MKHSIDFLQFYIGNVCNLTCPNCVSFNNYAFKGQFDWESNKLSAKRWSEILEPKEVAIIGGEPFTNLDIDNWVYGLREIFPIANFRITTNGTYLKRDIERIKKYTKQGVIIEVSSHSEKHFLEHNEFIKNYYPILKSSTVEKYYDIKNVYINDDVGYIEIIKADKFFKISVKEKKDGLFYMHDSNINLAHAACPINNCHYIVEGKLYKCVLTAIGKLFAEQFAVEPRAKDILKRSNYALPFDNEESLNQFFSTINNPCEQCTLCPEKYEGLSLLTLPKKKEKS